MPAPTIERSTRRDQLLEALVELFLAEGFRDLQVADIAARLHCSKSTLYAIAPSKEQLVAAVVRAFFRRSTDRVEARVAAVGGGQAEQIRVYLGSIADELEPGSPAFFADLESHPLAREIYGRNTAIAAQRIQELAVGIEGAAFLGYVAGITMEGIHRGEVASATGLDDFDAYRALARLIIATIEPTPGDPA